ncbi:hypothetical protein MNBD_NITROSPINAE01-1637 [hydrothermal vent metagenome]|uniref:Filament cap protein n=1 Tax=hydrothermal vent metagenome TaxID=652676 RepID=A0A3B1C8L6_9ZZZZ
MEINTFASYNSATADIGRKAPVTSKNRGRSASYYSATADVGKSQNLNARNTFVENSVAPRRGGSRNGTTLYQHQQVMGNAISLGPASALAFTLATNSKSLDNQSRFLDSLQNSLLSLSEKLLNMRSPDFFNSNALSSSNEEIIKGSASTLAERNTYTLTVEQLAESHQIASSEYLPPADNNALNLTGSFTINGYTITVASTDSLADIRDKINIGEDTNNNGVLDEGSEDSNGNGVLDTYYKPGVYIGNGVYTKAFSYSEDRNSNGILDAAEDTNGNGVIDGGSKNIKAEARIENGRLVIKSLDGGDTRLRLSDPNNVLENLGFYKRDNLEIKTLKSAIDNGENSSYYKDPQLANFTIDGNKKSSATNIVDGVIDDVTLELLDTTKDKVKITVYGDPKDAVDGVARFASAYNTVIKQVNEATNASNYVRENHDFQNFIEEFVSETQRSVESREEPPSSLKDIGAQISLSTAKNMAEAIVKSLATQPSDFGPFKTERAQAGGITSRLARLGILETSDLTLMLDREKLAKTLEKNARAVEEVFNTDPGGIATRLLARLSQAVGEPFNLIDIQNKEIEYFKSNPRAASAILKKRVSLAETEELKNVALSILSPIVA